MSLFDFVARSTLSPLQSMLNEEIFKINSKLQNSVDQFFAKGLKSLGLSSSITSQLSARFSDALVKDLADSFFQTATTEINRVSRGDIINNVSPRKRADTSYNVESRVKTTVDGLNTQGQLQYPSHLGDYYAVFEFYKYSRDNALKPSKLDLQSAIVLPLPRKLEEQVGISVAQGQLGFGGALTDNIKAAFKNFMADNTSAAVENLKSAAMNVATPMAYNKAQGLLRKAGEFVSPGSDLGALLGQELGAVVNPFLSAVFNGVELRTFGFDWRISPRNPEESRTIQQIIKQFKINSLPSFTKNNVTENNLLTYPSLCLVKLYPWHTDDSSRSRDSLIKFKPALIQNISINYADAGIPSFFAGTKLPTFISFSISMLETSIFTSEDYDPSFERNTNIDDIIGGVQDQGKKIVGGLDDKLSKLFTGDNPDNG